MILQRSLRLSSIIILYLLFMTACTRGVERYYYDMGGKDSRWYGFEFHMDTSCHYDVSMFTRLEGKDSVLHNTRSLPMDVVLVSPSGIRYSEEFDFEVYTDTGLWSYLCRRDTEVPYRTGVKVSEAGLWKMYVRVRNASSDEVILGLGICLKEEK